MSRSSTTSDKPDNAPAREKLGHGVATVESLLQATISKWTLSAPCREVARIYPVLPVTPLLTTDYLAKISQVYQWELVSSDQKEHIDDPNSKTKDNSPLPTKTNFLNGYQRFIEPTSKVFRLYEGDNPSVHAIDIAYRLLFPSSNPEISNPNPKLCEIINASAKFLEMSYQESGKGYALSPWDHPNVFSEYCAISAIRSFETARRYNSDWMPHTTFRIEEVADNLFQEDFTFDKKDIFGFKANEESHPCLSLTEHVYHISYIINQLLGNSSVSNKLRDKLTQKSKKTLGLIKACWDSQSGGFRTTPETSKPANLVHVRYAFRLLNWLFGLKCISQKDIEWLDIELVLSFIESCCMDGGLANFPDSLPTIHSEKHGISSTRHLRNFVSRHRITYKTQVINKIEEFQKSLSTKINPFLDSCIEPKSGLFMALPYKMLISGNEPIEKFLNLHKQVDYIETMTEIKNPHWRELYLKIKEEFGVPELEPEALRSLAEDEGSEDFLDAWRFYLTHEREISKKYPNQFVAISNHRVISHASSTIDIYEKLPPEYLERMLFLKYVTSVRQPISQSK